MAKLAPSWSLLAGSRQSEAEYSKLGGEVVKVGDEVFAGDAPLDHPTEAFTVILLEDRDDLGGGPRRWSHRTGSRRPTPGWGIGGWNVCGGESPGAES